MTQSIRRRVLAIGAVALTAGAVAAGLFLIGSPAHQRDLRIDERRVADLGRLSRAIDAFARRTGTLPGSLDALGGDAATPPPDITDPQTGRTYDYRMTGGKAYELCADFAAPSPSGRPAARFAHEAGHQCFSLTVTGSGAAGGSVSRPN